MFCFDGHALMELGYVFDSDEQEERFIAIIQDEISTRIGERTSNGISEELLCDFERIIDNDIDYIKRWLENNFPKYRESKAYRHLKKQGLRGENLMSETASTLWLKTNRPDYKTIVKQCGEEVKNELTSNRDQIMGK
ncbi:DUF5663 domain-containing protein [Lachnospiraceae bacterium ZAX-1]